MNASHTGLVGTSALALVLFAGCSAPKPPITAPVEVEIAAAPASGHTGVVLLEDFVGRQIFPASDGWNLDASQAPVDSNSQAYIDWISGRTAGDSTATCRPQAYFGPPPWGIPYVGVSGTQALLPVAFLSYPAESDPGAPGRPTGYPIPVEARLQTGFVEGNVAGGGTLGDRRLIVVDRDHGLLFEVADAHWNAGSGRWEGACGATFDLATGAARPDGWTSADAAGLAVFPGLVRYDEAYGTGEITHAFRTTMRATNGHVWPASHTSGSTIGAPPMGTRLRLKASVDLSAYPPEMQRIFRAMQTHGLIIADNGGCDLGVTGTMDPRWDSRVVYPAFATLTADDFEVVQLGWGRPVTP